MLQPDTPAVVIDLDRAEANIVKAQAYCDRHGLALRPHIKTHKLPLLAHRQVAAGAVGVTAQKVSEALVMAAAGLPDILVTYNVVGEQKLLALAQLAAMTERLSLALDNAVAVDLASRAARRSGRDIHILLEFESGKNRTGVQTPEAALALAERVRDAPGLCFAGFMTHPVVSASGVWVAQARALFEQAGLEAAVFSGGDTPGMWRAHEVQGLTELRPGTYVYHDRATVGAGAGTLEDCALEVVATVVSTPTATRAVIDAGSKTLSSDRIDPAYGEGFGLVLEYPDAVITSLSEEHGVVGLARSERRPRVGERVRVVPNHACVVTNLHDEVYVSRGGEVQGAWPVWARGKTR